MSELSKAYNRGYYAGSRSWYPKHAPPLPPDEVIANLIVALQDLYNAVDAELAMLDEDDPWEIALAPKLENAFGALDGYREWLRTGGAK